MSSYQSVEVPMQLRLESRQEWSFNPGKIQLTFVRTDPAESSTQFSYFTTAEEANTLTVGGIYEMTLNLVPPAIPAE